MSDGDVEETEAQRDGEELARRRKRLGMSVRQLSEHTGINRGTIANVEAGDARGTSIGAVKAALAKLEHEMGMDIPSAEEAPNELDLVEFQVAGNFGVRVVVKGPVRDRAELEESVLRLISRMQSDQPEQ